MTPEAKDLLRTARTTLADVVLPALDDPFALEQARTVLRVLTHLEATVDEAYPLERRTADDLGDFLAEAASSLAGDPALADLRGEIDRETSSDLGELAALEELRAASSRRKRLVTALIRGPLRERRGTEWAGHLWESLRELVRRQLARERRWMSPKPATRSGRSSP
jgi:hypothetical protein